MIRSLKIRLLFAVARYLRVPIDIHPTFFAVLKNEPKMSGLETCPK